MRLRLLSCLALLAIAGCGLFGGPTNIAQFWRPISEPNIEMPLDKAQKKLDFDLSQCNCGIFPTNVTHQEMAEFSPDKQRLSETSVTTAADENGSCTQQPSMIVAECMRSRGWEITNCSGRMPTAGGAAICAGYAIQQ